MEPMPVKWKEARRLRAWQLKQENWEQRDIAAALGVHEGTVSRWVKAAREGGPDALRDKPPPRNAAKLPTDKLARIPELLKRGPAAYGFRGELWTRPRVAEVVFREFGVRYHETHVGRLLRAAGWSPQKPVRRARQRDKEAIAKWRTENWPALKKGRKPKNV